MTLDCCEFSNLSDQLDTLSNMSYSTDTSEDSQAVVKKTSFLTGEDAPFDADCQGTDGCSQCRTGCCHLLIPVMSNLVSNSMNPDGFEEIPSAIYLSRIPSGPEEPPRA